MEDIRRKTSFQDLKLRRLFKLKKPLPHLVGVFMGGTMMPTAELTSKVVPVVFSSRRQVSVNSEGFLCRKVYIHAELPPLCLFGAARPVSLLLNLCSDVEVDYDS